MRMLCIWKIYLSFVENIYLMKYILQLSLACILFCFSYSASAKLEPATATTGKTPQLFVENKGQVVDQNNKPRNDIQFRLPAANGLNIFIGDGAIHYQFAKAEKPTQNTGKPGHAKDEQRMAGYRMDVTLVGANKNAQVITGPAQPYAENYGLDGTDKNMSTVRSFEKITYKDIYPNIDWVLYVANGKLKHEFVVHKGGNPANIKLQYGGATELSVNQQGMLVAVTPMGKVTEAAPVSFLQDKKNVKTSFKLSGNELSYEIAPYDGELTIDPDLQWATFYGGNNLDYCSSVAVDASNNVYVCGSTHSYYNIATAGAYSEVFIGSYMAFLARFSSSGVRQWATYYGGGADGGAAVATDNLGNVYMTGTTYGYPGMATPGTHQTTVNGIVDAFLVKFNSAGQRQWCTYYGGEDADEAKALAVDASGHIYVAGTTYSYYYMSTTGVHQTSKNYLTDGFLVKFDGTGNRVWGTYYGGEYNDESTSLAIDGAGNVVLSGNTNSTADIASPGAHQLSIAGDIDGFIVKFDNAGLRLWGTYYGGENYDNCNSVAIDASGNVFIGGETNSIVNVATPGAFQTVLMSSYSSMDKDLFLVKLNGSGVRQWGTYFGHVGAEGNASVKLDAAGNIYLAGNTGSDTAFATADAFQKKLGGSSDLLLARFNSSGFRTWASYYGWSGNEYCRSMTLDASGNMYVAGMIDATVPDFATMSAHQTALVGGYEGFLLKIANDISPITGTLKTCLASTTTLSNATPGGIWSSNNPYVALVGSLSGIVTGVSPGLAVITYTLPSGSYSTVGVPVSLPVIDAIAGTGFAGNTGDGGLATGATLVTPRIIARDASGNIFVSSEYKIRKINPAGIITTVAGNGTFGYIGDGGMATAARIGEVSGMVVDAGGNLYFSDMYNHTVRKVQTTGIITTAIGNGVGTTTGDGGPATSASVQSPMGLAIDGSGNIYCAEMGGARVRKVNTSGYISTVAGGGIGAPGDGGPATAAVLAGPMSVAVNAAGELFIADNTDNKIRKVNASGIISTFAGGGYEVYDGVPATNATLNQPSAIAVDTAGNVYIADQGHYRIKKVTPGGIINTYVGTGVFGMTGDGGAAIVARITGIKGICTDVSGNLYIAGAESNTVRKVTFCGTPGIGAITGTKNVCVGTSATLASTTTGGTWSTSDATKVTVSGGLITGIAIGSATITYTYGGSYAVTNVYVGKNSVSTYIGNGTWANTGDGGPRTAAQVKSPIGITRDNAGNIYFTAEHVVRKIDASGVVSTVAGINGVSGFGGDFGLATSAYLSSPGGLAVDNAGNLYIADRANNRIRKIDASGIITTIIGNGDYNDYGDNGPATLAACANPQDVAVDAAGNIYFTDWGAGRIRKIDGAGIVSVVAGAGGWGFSGDGGPATTAMLAQPWGLTIDNTGNLYLADYGNHRVRKISATGIITTIAGSSTVGYSGDGGAATSAALQQPSGVTVDAAGNVFVTDMTNYRIRKIATSGIISTVAGNGTYGYSGDGTAASDIQITQSAGVMTDTAGNIYFTEYQSNAIRKISPCNSASEIPPITGTLNVCVGNTTTLSNTAPGGTWSSASGNVTVSSGTGVVTGVTAGTAVVSYTSTAGTATAIVTVFAVPAAITGPASVCAAETITLACVTTGGTWSSSTPTVGTISATGIVTGAASGTSTISYTLPTGCFSTKTVTVSAAPAAITGTLQICAGTTTTLATTTTGGTWSVGTPAVGNIAATGVVTGLSAGTTLVSYTLSSGCRSTAVVTVNALPAAITGTAIVCEGATTTLASATSGGTWGSSGGAASVASATGIVTGNTAGTATISYIITATSCYRTVVATVNALPAAITGTATLCAGSTTTLATTTTGGTWSSGTPAVGSISATGVVTGISAGTTIVSYTVSSGCRRTAIVTVNALPAAITGTATVCEGATTTLASATSGGTWSSSGSAASIDPSTGVITGVGAGTATISYTLSATSCYRTVVATVNALPAVITGTATVCVGSATTLANTTTGGTWSSTFPMIATISSAGVVTGMNVGTTEVSYTLATGCRRTQLVTVNPTPAAITGTLAVCAGSGVSLASTTTGGVWTSSATGVATVGASSGAVAGIVAGTSTISYTISATGCAVAAVLTVNALPAAITGPATVCAGASVTLASATTGGTWTSGSTGIATIAAATGIATAVAAGTVTMTYTLPTGCLVTKTITVNPIPATITGTLSICDGATTALSNTTAGGTWSSSPATTASITSSGIVTGVAPGTATISYSLIATGCANTAVVTVNPLPAPITGLFGMCSGAGTTLSDATTGGTWASGSTGIVTIGSATGIANGIAAGTAQVTYTLPTGCISVATITVNPMPAAISGAPVVCVGATTTLTDATTGGTWSCSPATVATVGAASGVVAGVAAGAATVTYALPTGCSVTTIVTVNPLPPSISGVLNICMGGSTTLTNPLPGGTWSSGATSIVTVGSATGVVSGVAHGTASISYALPTGCMATATIAVDTLPTVVVTGADYVCIGNTTTMSSSVSGGTWASSSAAATITAAGVVTGASAGTAVISYSYTNVCGTATGTRNIIVYTTAQCDSILATDIVYRKDWSAELFPNPNVGAFSVIVHSDMEEPIDIVICNVLGQKVWQGAATTNKLLNISANFAAGAYTLTAQNQHRKYIVKFVNLGN